jgi:predicted enzyme related to lactoylglutathione lyase
MNNGWRWLAGALVLVLGLGGCSTAEVERASGLPLSEEPLTGKFVWHDLMTDDIAAARRFYGGLFGWTFRDETRPNGRDYTLILANGRYVAGMVQLDDPAGVEYSRWLGYLSVEDVDRAAAFNGTNGGEIVVGPLDLGEWGRAAAITDPQGAVVGLIRSRLGDPDDSIRRGVGEVVWNELLAEDDMAAADFYTGLAGLDRVDDQRTGGVYRIMRSQGRDRAGIMLRPAEDYDPVWLTHFGVADVSEAARKAAALGGDVLIAPSPEIRNGLMALVTDPNGAVLVLHQWTE